jgi:hypothetical protein
VTSYPITTTNGSPNVTLAGIAAEIATSTTSSEVREAAFSAIVDRIPARVGVVGAHRDMFTSGWSSSRMPAQWWEADLAIWCGPDQKGGAGSLFVPGAYTTAAIRAAKDASDPWTVDLKRLGLTDDAIPFRSVGLQETDHLSLDEQVALYDDYERVGGVRFGLVVLSGDNDPVRLRARGLDPQLARKGKSLHPWWLFARALRSDDPDDLRLWAEINFWKVVALQCDSAVINAGRLIRTPGLDAWDPTRKQYRSQAVARVDATARPRAEDVVESLRTFARHLGISTLADAGLVHEAYLLAERLEQRSRSSKLTCDLEDREEIAELAREIRDARRVTPAQREMKMPRRHRLPPRARVASS